MDTSKLSVEKLNGKNYRIWAAQIKAILSTKRLIHYIRIKSETPRDATDKDFVEREKQQVVATLLCTIEAKFVQLIMDKEEPHEMWHILENSHKSKCAAAQLTLRNKFMNLKMKPGSTV